MSFTTDVSFLHVWKMYSLPRMLGVSMSFTTDVSFLLSLHFAELENDWGLNVLYYGRLISTQK